MTDSYHSNDNEQDQQGAKNKSHQRSMFGLLGIALLMFGFAFALVPLYDIFCQITGLNGKTRDQAAIQSQNIDFSREVTVEFIAYTSAGMNWAFAPQVLRLKVHPGETHTIAYVAKNNTQQNMIGHAVPSVTPGIAAKYFNKVECFCFNQQPLNAGEDAQLPLIFYVDPKLPNDIQTLTLAYTLYPSKSDSVIQ